MGACTWRTPGGPTFGDSVIRLLVVLGVLEGALYGCAADPNREATDAAAADSADSAAPPDRPFFEAEASVYCSTTVPNTIPLQSDAGGETCLFQISPPLPSGDIIYEVLANGTALLSTEFEWHGRDSFELIGQACVDYRAGTLTNVSVFVTCID